MMVGSEVVFPTSVRYTDNMKENTETITLTFRGHLGASSTETLHLKSFGLQGWAWSTGERILSPQFQTKEAARTWSKQIKSDLEGYLEG